MKPKKYTRMTKEDAYRLSALGKFIDYINQVYYDTNAKILGKSKVPCLFRNILNINQARSIDTDYIRKRFEQDPINPYGRTTILEKQIISEIVEGFMLDYEEHPENKTEAHKMYNPNAAYRNKNKNKNQENNN